MRSCAGIFPDRIAEDHLADSAKWNPTPPDRRSAYSHVMCNRFTSTLGPGELTRQIGGRFGVRFTESVSAGTDPWDIRPTNDVPAIVTADGVPEPRMLRWGLVPPWAQELKTGLSTYNAQLERIRDTGRYAGVPVDAAHRCLMLADGFYEWAHPEDRKLKGQPYRFTVDGGQPFAFAAVWAANRRLGTESCSIITCDSGPNPLVAKVHDRMPVILTDRELWAWLNPAVALPDALSLCRALPAGRMKVEARQPGSSQPAEQFALLI
jgi:putative SOS response-associated peptidase YedK